MDTKRDRHPFKDEAHRNRYKKILDELGQMTYVKNEVVIKMLKEADEQMTDELINEQI